MDDARTNTVVVVKDDHNACINQLDRNSEDKNAWVYGLQKRVSETKWRDAHCTIYRVPRGLRMVDPSAYQPQILSLGPYHHGKPHLQAMEELKWCYLKRFLHRNLGKGLEDYLNLVETMEAQSRNVYSEAPHMDSKQWVEMMLLDCCFTVELLLMLDTKHQEFNDEELDPIQSTVWMCFDVLIDMLLLENQLPFFLLKKLLELTSLSSTNGRSLAMIVLDVFMELMPGKVQISSLNSIDDIHHILHLLHVCMLPDNHATIEPRCRGLRRRLWSFCIDHMLWKFTRKNTSSSSNNYVSNEPSPLQWVPPAKNLKDAGVAFRKKTKNVTSFMDITFQGGTLEIPPLQIMSYSNLLLRNLIAFEQCHAGNQSPIYVSNYAFLMDCIIDTPADVVLLQQEGIIVGTLGSHDNVAQFFNRLRTNAMVNSNSYLSGVFKDVHHHCDKRRNKWKASLNHNYFSNPWASVSVIAAIFLFLLTMTQTLFAVLSYVRPGSP